MKLAARQQSCYAALLVQAATLPADVKAEISAILSDRCSGQAAALAYKALPGGSESKLVRIALCDAIALHAAALAKHGDRDVFHAQLEVLFEGPLGDKPAAQIHMAYRSLMTDVPGAFLSNNAAKGRKRSAKKRVDKSSKEIRQNKRRGDEDSPLQWLDTGQHLKHA